MDATRAILYVSEDEGASFTTQNLSPSTINPTSLLFHPTEQDWILAHDPVNNAVSVYIFLSSDVFRSYEFFFLSI